MAISTRHRLYDYDAILADFPNGWADEVGPQSRVSNDADLVARAPSHVGKNPRGRRAASGDRSAPPPGWRADPGAPCARRVRAGWRARPRGGSGTRGRSCRGEPQGRTTRAPGSPGSDAG